MGILPFVFVKRLHGRSPPYAGPHDLARQNAGLRTDHRAAENTSVVAHTDLTANYAIVFDHSTAGNTGLRGDDNPFTYLDVVGDLDQIVDLCAFADPRFTQRSTIDTR